MTDAGPRRGTCESEGVGGYECVGGPCSYTCCIAGILGSCSLSEGSECGTIAPTECGGGACVGPGESCPDAGASLGSDPAWSFAGAYAMDVCVPDDGRALQRLVTRTDA